MSHVPALRPELDARLDALAIALARPKAWVIEQAIEDYLALQAGQLAAIDAGIRAADAGEMVDHAAVEAWVASWGGDRELPRPECG